VRPGPALVLGSRAGVTDPGYKGSALDFGSRAGVTDPGYRILSPAAGFAGLRRNGRAIGVVFDEKRRNG